MSDKPTTGHVKIKLGPDGLGTVSVDGEEIHCVRSLEFTAGVDNIPSLTLHLRPFSIEIEADAEVRKDPI